MGMNLRSGIDRSDLPFDELPINGARPEVSEFAYLGSLPPGIILGVILERIDRSGVSGHDMVHVMSARQRQISHLQAELLADMTFGSTSTP